MDHTLRFSKFTRRFATEDACLEEIIQLRYPKGVYCKLCKHYTTHYKLRSRAAYSCKNCRHHVYPLAGTIFEKTTTPLRVWFFAIFLLSQTKGNVSAKQLQRELGVTYKTAWRIKHLLYELMKQHNGDLLQATDVYLGGKEQSIVHRFTLFNTLEFRLVEKKKSQ